YAAAAKPLPRQGLSGAEIFLAILIVIIGSGMYEGRRHFGAGMRFPPFRRPALDVFGESFDYPISQQKAIGEKSRILFDGVRGNIRVTGADAAEIRLTGRKTIRAYNKADADRVNEQSPLEISTDGDRVIVRSNQDRISEDRRATTELEVTVPRAASIEGRG